MSEIVDIFDISYEGAGVGKIGGQVVFVPKSLKGEKAEVEVVKQTRSFLVGKVVKIVSASENRISAKCPYFEICGGCDFQHCNYETEQKVKEEILKKELKKIEFDGKIDFVSSPKRFAYRNKIKLEVVDGKLGYFKAKSHKFFEVETCPIASENILKTLPHIKNFIANNSFKNLKSVYIKEAGEQIAICFLFEKNAQNVRKNVKNMSILSDFSVFFAFGDVLESDGTKVFHMFGKDVLSKNYGDFSATIDVSSFNQINDDVATKLYEFVCELTAKKRVVNAYSGQGVLTRLISENAKFVYGIELQKSAHESAIKLMETLPNVENICGKVEEKLSQILLRDRIDAIVLDPARDGCKANALEEILQSDISSVIYVSCNFATLTRDLKVLKERFQVEKVCIFDMFPCTCNMETVAVLRRVKKDC